MSAASAMCTLCGFAGEVETNVDRGEGVATALAFAVHFAMRHPEVREGAGRHLVMVPASRGAFGQ